MFRGKNKKTTYEHPTSKISSNSKDIFTKGGTFLKPSVVAVASTHIPKHDTSKKGQSRDSNPKIVRPTCKSLVHCAHRWVTRLTFLPLHSFFHKQSTKSASSGSYRFALKQQGGVHSCWNKSGSVLSTQLQIIINPQHAKHVWHRH